MPQDCAAEHTIISKELSSRDHAATQIFLFNRTLFQGEHLPPSNAVLPAAPLQGYWTARKGRTTFPFSFHIPHSAPSSVQFAGQAKLRYILKGSVQAWWNETKTVVTVRSDAFVVERWHDELSPLYMSPVEAVTDTHVFMGGSGAVWLEAGISERLFVAGSMVLIRTGVKNNTKRHLSGMKVAIARRLVFPVNVMSNHPAQKVNLEPQFTEIVHTQHFKGPSYEFPPHEEVVVNLAVNLPRDLRYIRKTRLFEVHTFAIISAEMGTFAKDLSVEIPLFVAHPGSLQRPASSNLDQLHNIPQRSRSAMGQHGQYHHHHGAVTPYQNGLDQLSSASPVITQNDMTDPHSGPMSPLALTVTPSRPSSAAAVLNYEAFSVPPPPVKTGPEGQLIWDPNVPGWTASSFLQPQQAFTRPTSAQETSRKSSTSSLSFNLDDTSRPSRLRNQEQVRRASAPVAGETGLAPQKATYLDNALYVHTQSQNEGSQSPSVAHSSREQGVPSPSQLLGMYGQPLVGLDTIQEDSESAANTLKSSKTFTASVTRNDIDQFEKFAQQADDERVMQNAMRGMGMVPDNESLAIMPDKMPFHTDKSLPEAPTSRSTAEVIRNARPKASGLFDQPVTLRNVSRQRGSNEEDETEQQADIKIRKEPKRAPSAQGEGLAALESRLRAEPEDAKSRDAITPNRKTPPIIEMAKSGWRSTIDVGQSALKAAAIAAAERERRAREDEAARLLDEKERKRAEERRQTRLSISKYSEERKSVGEHNTNKPSCTDGKKVSSQPFSPTTETQRIDNRTAISLESSPGRLRAERKSVNVEEQRQLNKEAVSRVAGWLSQNPTRDLKSSSAHVKMDITTLPKTPSPSTLLQDGQGAQNHRNSLQRNKATLTSEEHSEGMAANDVLENERLAQKSPSSEQKRRTRLVLPEHSTSSNAVPRQNAAASTVSEVGEPIPKELPHLEGSENRPYDVRSARGGKGGRVANVASMWASIADGTDGNSQLVPSSTVTLKPKALRTGVGAQLSFITDQDNSQGVDAPPNQAEMVGIKAKKARGTAVPLFIAKQANKADVKGTRAAHFINTTMPRPVFSAKDQVVNNSAANGLPPAVQAIAETVEAEREKQLETSLEGGKLKASRKITSDLIAAEARMSAGQNLAEDALPMGGRGTTKPIGRERLADLRSLWGG